MRVYSTRAYGLCMQDKIIVGWTRCPLSEWLEAECCERSTGERQMLWPRLACWIMRQGFPITIAVKGGHIHSAFSFVNRPRSELDNLIVNYTKLWRTIWGSKKRHHTLKKYAWDLTLTVQTNTEQQLQKSKANSRLENIYQMGNVCIYRHNTGRL